MAVLTLDEGRWKRAGFDSLADALGGPEGITRLVGGAVRDGLAGLPVQDIDLATQLTPQEVIARLDAATIKSVPTGIAHGTVTAVLASGPVEITTLRRDVSTDGRRATIAFSDDWREDAARRDFTINALYADLQTGEVHDYFGGVADLGAGIVRFIGDPLTRIAEDHLRILRFFRFHARFGKDAPEAAGLAACTARANDLMALSRERIADELLKLLALPNPVGAVRTMLDASILIPVLPEIGPDAHLQLQQLIANEAANAVAGDPLRRLAALLPADPEPVVAVATRLKLSNKARKRLRALADRTPDDAATPRQLAYWQGRDIAIDRLLLGNHSIAPLRDWTPPIFPLSGKDIIARGVPPGPEVAIQLQFWEREWVDAGFPATDKER